MAKKTSQHADYRAAIVTFIDILGFRSIVSKRDSNEIYELVKLVQRHAGASDEDAVKKFGLEEEANWTRCVFFSDSVVRVRMIDAEFREGALFHELIDLVHAQGELAHQGVFIRGGLTVGQIHHSDGVIFGPAMVRAYDLESSFANYPRIVIDPDVFTFLRTDKRLIAEHHDLNDEIGYLKGLVRQGEDGLHYVDYLGAFRNEMDNPEKFPEYLAALKAEIISQANAVSKNLSVLQKYLWLARYVNAVAANYLDCEDAMITAADISAMSAVSDLAPS